jgi:hypothetical protein
VSIFSKATAALSVIQDVLGMAKGTLAANTQKQINDAIIDIQRAFLEAQSAAFDDKEMISRLSDEKAALEMKLKSISNWEAEMARYVLTRSPKGAFTYDLRTKSANGEVFHRLCATCFAVSKKSILQTLAEHSGGEIVKCQSCDQELELADFQYEIISAGRSKDGFDDFP